jgi:hypothetical protein
MMSPVISRSAVGRTAQLAGILVLVATTARGQPGSGPETLERPDGRRVDGRIEGDARSGFRFVPRGGDPPSALEPGCVVHHAAPGPDPLASPPPFQILVGQAARLSGSLRAVTRTEVRLAVGWQAGEVTLPRPCVQAIVQRPGEARVLVDGFEALDGARWSISGKPETTAEPHASEQRSLRLPAEGAALSHRLDEPLATGRLDLAFFDEGSVVPGRLCVVEPAFRGPAGPSAMRIILGWSEESLAVESPSGPALAVQRLARSPGWHRLSLRFGPDQTEIAVDGKELAHGKGPEGPLTAIRLATLTTAGGPAPPPAAPAAHFDDLQLIRFAEPPASLEIDAAQDEARLVVGDQLYGEIRQADADRTVIAVDGQPVALRWGEVSGLYFRRVPIPGTPVEGLLVRAEWRPAPGDRPPDLDFAEGALAAQTDGSLALATPYAGTLTIPRGRLRRLVVLGQGRRLVIDPSAHHLGDEISVTAPVLDPPQPEGLTLERTFELAEVPGRPAELVLDVVQVVSETADSKFAHYIRAGELRTYLAVNGRRIDYLNRHIKTPNEELERVRIPIPPDVLRAGRNALRIEVTGTSSPGVLYDDLGILQIALEFPN